MARPQGPPLPAPMGDALAGQAFLVGIHRGDLDEAERELDALMVEAIQAGIAYHRIVGPAGMKKSQAQFRVKRELRRRRREAKAA